jgi:hypothetical protein
MSVEGEQGSSIFRGGVAGHVMGATWPLGRIDLSAAVLDVRISALPWWSVLRVERSEAVGIVAATRNEWTYVVRMADGTRSNVSFSPMPPARFRETARRLGWLLPPPDDLPAWFWP